MWTTGHVSVRVMPSRFCTLDTTSLPSSSTLRASARTITSYGPVTSSARVTPLTWAMARATSLGVRYARGIIREKGHVLFVSPGIGTSSVPVRLGVPPEISLLKIE